MTDYQVVSSNFLEFVKKISESKQVSSAWLEAAWNNYDVEEMGLEGLTIPEITTIHQEILSKYQSRQLKKVWCENQNKLFMWMLCQWEAFTKKKAIDFSDNDWDILTACLPRKSVEDVKFEFRMLSKAPLNEIWEEEQISLLNQIIAEQKLENKWNQVSKQLFKLSDQKYFRRPKQCREQWKNHLDPEIQKGGWTPQNDYDLLELVLDIGKKWSSISKCIGKRTQHAVKNRFHSLIKQYSKVFRKNSKSKSIGKRKDQEQELINYIMKSLKQLDPIQQQDIKVAPKKKKPPVKPIKQTVPKKVVAEQSKPVFANPAPVPQNNMKDMFMRGDQIDNRIGYVYSPLTPYTYLDKNKQLGNLLLVTSPRIISPRFKMITQWEDLDNKEYFYEL